MNEERIIDIFHRLRELPSDVSLGEVEHWARLHAAGELVPQTPSLGGSSLPFKPPLYMTSIITAAAATGLAALIALYGTDDPQSKDGSLATANDSTISLVCDTPAVKVNLTKAPQGDSSLQQITILAPQMANVTVYTSDSSGTSSFSFGSNGSQSFSSSFPPAKPLEPLNSLPPTPPIPPSPNETIDPAAEQALASAEQELANAQQELATAQQEGSARALADAYQQIADAQQALADAQEEIADARSSSNYSYAYNNNCVCAAGGNDDVRKGLEKQLLKDGLIRDTVNYSLELSNNKLSINNKRQPPEVHQRYLKLYVELNGGDNLIGTKFTYAINVKYNTD